MAKTDFKTIDQYIATFPDDVQIILEKVRKTIKEVASEAQEAISYQIPTFKLNGKYLIYFAGWKKHVSLYPIPKGDESIRKEIAPFVKGKGTISFPLDKPLPFSLIAKVVKFSMKENKEKYKPLKAS